MPVLILWAVPAVLVVGGVGYWIVHMHPHERLARNPGEPFLWTHWAVGATGSKKGPSMGPFFRELSSS